MIGRLLNCCHKALGRGLKIYSEVINHEATVIGCGIVNNSEEAINLCAVILIIVGVHLGVEKKIAG